MHISEKNHGLENAEVREEVRLLAGSEAVLLDKFKSKKNHVFLVRPGGGGEAVVKIYSCGHAEGEVELLETALARGVPVPLVLAAGERGMVMEYVSGKNVMDLLNGCAYPTEKESVARSVGAWLKTFHNAFCEEGLIMSDANLRNFVVREQDNKIFGVDLEEAVSGEALEDLGALCASILASGDMFTPEKFLLCCIAIEGYSSGEPLCVDEETAKALEDMASRRDDPSLNEMANAIRQNGICSM